jgi:uncharacterized protein
VLDLGDISLHYSGGRQAESTPESVGRPGVRRTEADDPAPALLASPPNSPHEPTLTPTRASSILRRFRQHLAGWYTVIEVTPELLDEAMRLGNAHSLRAYDAVQLAVALEVNRSHQADGFAPVTLISADQALNDAATAEGLTVDDPNRHP